MAAQGTQGPSSKIETYAAEVTGNRLPDEWGNHFEVSWSLKENPSQPAGIVRQLRTCILLTRETDDEFQLVPTIEVTPNFAGRAVSLFSSRPADDPVVFDPSYEPYNKLDREIRCVSAYVCTFMCSTAVIPLLGDKNLNSKGEVRGRLSPSFVSTIRQIEVNICLKS